MIVFQRNAYFRDGGLGCLGTYLAMRVAFWRFYFSFGWRVSK